MAAVFLMGSAVQAFRNDEFGLQATVPAGYPECIAHTQGHVHGVGTVLVGRDCENPGNGPAFNVWADYNAAEYPNALEMLRGERCSGPRLRWADGEWDRVLAGRRTALCRFEGPGDIVELRLATQAWPVRGETRGSINYTVYFGSTKSRVERDLQVLRLFVRSIRIVRPEA